MRHLLIDSVTPENLGIIVSRQTVQHFQHIFVTQLITDRNFLDTAGRFGNGSLFPLYRYPSGEGSMFAATERTANFSEKFVAALEERLGKPMNEGFTPEEVLYWWYAVLHSREYRLRYGEFLKIDFPRVPLPSSLVAWNVLTPLGKQLVETHLMERSDLTETVTFPERGTNIIQSVKWEDERVYINGTQYVGGVRQEVWKMQIGGYQPAEKWLKDRKGRELSYDDVEHYRRVIASLEETLRLQDALDRAIEELGGMSNV
ncbi:MAG: hypothetical protein EAZ92_08260 [Candidatus Kapaibacterium sp.]|nr:MAG: hypothetical protein EAZ92_08260 [Candidatus Kapabacteria bacterium]